MYGSDQLVSTLRSMNELNEDPLWLLFHVVINSLGYSVNYVRKSKREQGGRVSQWEQPIITIWVVELYVMH